MKSITSTNSTTSYNKNNAHKDMMYQIVLNHLEQFADKEEIEFFMANIISIKLNK